MRSVDVFAGAGGAALGLRAAGCESLACVEWDPDACETLRAHGFPVVEADVRAWARSGDVPDAIGLGWFSPPCQAFSSAGKRLGAIDERNGWPWTLDAIDLIRPKWAVCENVPGLTHHRGDCDGTGEPEDCPGCYWLRWIVPEFRRRFAWVGTWRLDAADFGVPQHRRRVFLVAGPRPVRSPQPTHGPPGQLGLFGQLLPWVTIGEALGLTSPVVAAGVTGMGRPRDPEHPAPTISGKGTAYEAARVIGGGTNPHGPGAEHERTHRDITEEPSTTIAARHGGGAGNAGPFVVEGDGAGLHLSYLRGEPVPVTEPAPTVRAGGNRSGVEGRMEGGKAPYLHRPASTVLASESKGSGPNSNAEKLQNASAALYLSTGRRRLTVDECARLQGFPEGHAFSGTKTAQYRQVGNAVPPAMARAVAEAIIGVEEDPP